jgi:Uma2 family endonuclease
MLTTQRITVAEFDQFIALPQNSDRNFEFIAGEIVPVVSNNKASHVAQRIMMRLGVYVEDHQLGYTTGADGGYVVADERYIPDGAFVRADRQATAPAVAYNPLAPDLAVEVLSPGNTDGEITRKLGNYLAAGTVVWVVDPDQRTIDVYTPNQARITLHHGDILEGGMLVPGFRLAVAAVFPA